MTAFGGIFGLPEFEDSTDESGENGERGRIVGLDLDSGVVRIRPPRPARGEEPPRDEPEG